MTRQDEELTQKQEEIRRMKTEIDSRTSQFQEAEQQIQTMQQERTVLNERLSNLTETLVESEEVKRRRKTFSSIEFLCSFSLHQESSARPNEKIGIRKHGSRHRTTVRRRNRTKQRLDHRTKTIGTKTSRHHRTVISFSTPQQENIFVSNFQVRRRGTRTTKTSDRTSSIRRKNQKLRRHHRESAK